ncbi:AAA-domain-containing protein [Dentipellis sp. KUC8613]|nr:AAA-domain-containing protein [Dentipellis sp. KUC8613]
MQPPADPPAPSNSHPFGFEGILNPSQFFTGQNGEYTDHSLKIRVPPMNLRNRHRTNSTHSAASGSIYNDSNASMDVDLPLDEDAEGEDDPQVPPPPPVQYGVSSRGRRIAKKSYVESEDDGTVNPDALLGDEDAPNGDLLDDAPDEDESAPRRRTRSSAKGPPKKYVVMSSDEGDAGSNGGRRYPTRSRSKKPDAPASNGSRTRRQAARTSPRTTRISRSRPGMRTRRSAQAEDDADGYVDEPEESASADGSFEDALHTSSDVEPEVEIAVDEDADADGEVELEQEDNGRPYALRRRAKVNYAIPPPLEEIPSAPPKPKSGGRGRNDWNRGRKGPGFSATGAELGRFLGLPTGDDSDSDAPGRAPLKGLGGAAFTGGVGPGPSGILPADLAAAAGGPSNFGKVGDAALADTDPLGVNQNVTFDEVGGLDDHINSLKDMTLLPLLYPEVFQQFNLTPPRGVLFHGPPGTGKTLLARALAANCRSNGKGISFFMRKGADVLSKWVGEAERQLRLLFEEARNCQPSIIFFDEIDGLAPVRSSKQDQIHASIVSTLLALMDGMDGRGQVIVIGATNRPDAVDPALRRPGRFDREFYFPLPDLNAREKILRIMTKKWEGWEGEKGEENAKGLAKMTKGYGGADLRALCTEAALNAIQRRYPQIYKSNDRLLLKPETINVQLRDFMLSIKKIVPSSARSSSSVATPLPPQLVPLLSDTFDKVKSQLNKVMPLGKKTTALEEAEWEDEGQDNALERELLLQSMETLRVYRPRVILHGPPGMGQGYIGTAALHHLEGYHVQNLDLGTLMGDSTRTSEAAIVQLFVEAKRHQPSIIYIPSLIAWCAAVSETTRTTVQSMLNTLAPTDPVLLLAVVEGSFMSLPRDVRSWFGPSRENRIEIAQPSAEKREAFFDGILKDVERPPNHFPDGMKRKKRVLEELPIAPPLQPRQPSAAELAVQEENDQRLVTLLRYRLGPILTELKRKFKRFTKRAVEEYNFDPNEEVAQTVTNPVIEVATTAVETQPTENGIVEQVNINGEQMQVEAAAAVDGIPTEQVPAAPPPPPPAPVPKLFDMDLERMHYELYRNRYLTPQDFLSDVGKMVYNANIRVHEDPERLYRAQAMYTAAEVSILDFDAQFRVECERMAARERQRREERKKQRQKDRASLEAEVNGDTYQPGTRRSARNNGQEPEIAITDPLLLERKLKRQRSKEASGDSQASGEENGEGRDAKRTRLSEDPLNIGPGPPTPQHVSTVHFAEEKLPPPPHPPVELAPPPEASTSAGVDNIQVDAPIAPRLDGFDPTLLNPVDTSAPGFFSPHNPVAHASHHLEPALHNHPDAPIVNEMHVDGQQAPAPALPQIQSPQIPMLQIDGPRAPTDAPREATPAQAPSPIPVSAQAQDAAPEPAPEEPMEVERERTPLPDFHVSDNLLADLRRELRDATAPLSIEQLEQLRATCLGCVWRHRAEWDRDALVRELHSVVEEFVDEVRADLDEERGDAMRV